MSGVGTSILYDARIRVSTSKSLRYAVRRYLTSGKLLSIMYDVRKRVSKSSSSVYGVTVPISSGGSFSSAFSTAYASQAGASAKEVVIQYGVRRVVQASSAIQYDTQIVGATMVSKTLGIKYHTLIVPAAAVADIIVVPIPVDDVPPQIVTTSSL